MGKVKAWAMDYMEDIQFNFLQGNIDAQQCATALAKSGLMEPDEIELWIDDATAERAKNIADSALQGHPE
jgi:hypothetical protein